MTDRQRKKKYENALRLLAELLAGYKAMHRTEDVELTKFIIEKLRDHMWKEGIR